MKVSAEIDFHNHTATQMRHKLEDSWSRRSWHGLPRVRIIHGKGEVLIPELRRWCMEKGIDWSPEPGNPGATFIYPGRRTLPASSPANKIASPELRAFRDRIAAGRHSAAKPTIQPASASSTASSSHTSSTKSDLLLEPTGSTAVQGERSVDDERLFDAELKRLSSEHSRGILRNKHDR